MPERGVRKQRSTYSLIEDAATRAAFRNVEDRIKEVEKRIALPNLWQANHPQQSIVNRIGTTGVINQLPDLSLSVTTNGGYLVGMFRSIPTANGLEAYPCFSVESPSGNPSAINIYRDNVFQEGWSLMPALQFWPFNIVNFIHALPRGTYNYRVEMIIGADSLVQFNNLQFIVIELYPLKG